MTAWLGQRILPSGDDALSSGQIVLWLLGFLLLAAAVGLYRFTQIYFFHMQTLAQQARLILTTNPQHRAQVHGPPHLQNLAQTINDFAHQFEQMRADQTTQIARARADLEMERNRLGALLAELTEGVLVCNMAGQILLYNVRAAQLLGPMVNEQTTVGFIGLDRPVIHLIDGGAIEYARQELQHRWERNKQSEHPLKAESLISPNDMQARFVATAANGRLIRVRMAPIADAAANMNGFVMAFDDVTQEIEHSDQQQTDFEQLHQRLRSGLGNIRAAIETVIQHSDMTATQLQRFHHVIQEEVQALSSRIHESSAAYEASMQTVWRLEEMHGADLLQAIQRNLCRELGLSVETDESSADLWLRVDSYTLLRGYLGLLKQLQTEHGVQSATVRLAAHGQFAALDFFWRHRIDNAFMWQQLQDLVMTVDAGDAVITLREVADRHNGEAWLHRLPDGDVAAATANVYARLLLPLAAQAEKYDTPASFGRSLAHYDFALLQQTPRHAELDLHPLHQLTYTVFDTETTGLDPRRDQIVSLAAVRIVNGRLRETEVLNTLVDPGRSISTTATAIHGITNEMVAGQMTIAQAFPQFLHFAEGAILLGHNVAFDMRLFQQLPRADQLTHPLLDTLLLSAVLHPDQEDHSLEHLAIQLGVPNTDRHTALGDALLTARVFLRMLPLLADRGIYTLAEARQACAESYMGKIRY